MTRLHAVTEAAAMSINTAYRLEFNRPAIPHCCQLDGLQESTSAQNLRFSRLPTLHMHSQLQAEKIKTCRSGGDNVFAMHACGACDSLLLMCEWRSWPVHSPAGSFQKLAWPSTTPLLVSSHRFFSSLLFSPYLSISSFFRHSQASNRCIALH